MNIDADALRAGLADERRELQRAIADDEHTLRDGDDEQVTASLELRRSQLRRIEHSLQRHEAGTWRACEECGADIADDQLRALPTATHCEECAGDQVYWGDTLTMSQDELSGGA